MTARAKAARVMKCRWPRCCSQCGVWVPVGNLIMNRGHGWICLPRGLGHLRDRQKETTT